MALDYGIKSTQCWGTAPRSVRHKWIKQFCNDDNSIISDSCKSWKNCCEMQEEYGIVSEKHTNNAPDWVIDKWRSQKCDQHINTCQHSKYTSTISI